MKKDAPGNLLVDGLLARDRARLIAASELVALRAGDMLLRAGELIETAVFPLDTAISLLIPVAGRVPTEAGLIGREGLLGLELVHGAAQASFSAVVQNAGHAWRIDGRKLRQCLRQSPALRARVDSYANVRMLQLAQSAACRSFHRLEPRLARWILMSWDRVGGGEMRLTHDLLADMLGARRAGVTLAANALRRRRLIGYSRGRMSVLDVRGLENSACECYRAEKDMYARHM